MSGPPEFLWPEVSTRGSPRTVLSLGDRRPRRALHSRSLVQGRATHRPVLEMSGRQAESLPYENAGNATRTVQGSGVSVRSEQGSIRNRWNRSSQPCLMRSESTQFTVIAERSGFPCRSVSVVALCGGWSCVIADIALLLEPSFRTAGSCDPESTCWIGNALSSVRPKPRG